MGSVSVSVAASPSVIPDHMCVFVRACVCEWKRKGEVR